MKRGATRQPTLRLRIERLELDLHGVAPPTAEAAARLLGPALARALAGHRIGAVSGERMDAGRIGLTGAVDARTLASQLAQRIAGKTTEG